MKTNAGNINIKNKRASFDYEFIDTYTAGIVLTGTEIKSIRQGKASLVDTFCFFSRGELWVKNMHIAEYFYGSYNNHSARRDRKLLLTKKNFVNLNVLLPSLDLPLFRLVCILMKRVGEGCDCFGKGKKQYDKRQTLKEKEDKRMMDRMFKR